MDEERIFVGRKDELEQFGKVLEDPKGQAVLVVGQAGISAAARPENTQCGPSGARE
jgi:hypothetical protein